MDICVLSEKSFTHGSFFLHARPIGGLRMIDGNEADDKIVAVLESDLAYGRIQEILDYHPDLRFVLIGDSGEHDPEIYASIARANPGRVIAIYIREVRLDPGDGRVEQVSGSWDDDVPFVLAADSDAVRRHAAGLGLL